MIFVEVNINSSGFYIACKKYKTCDFNDKLWHLDLCHCDVEKFSPHMMKDVSTAAPEGICRTLITFHRCATVQWGACSHIVM